MEKLEGNINPITIDLGEQFQGVEVRKATAAQLFSIVDLVKHIVKSLGITSFSQEALQSFATKMQEDTDMVFNLYLENDVRVRNVMAGLSSLDRDQVDSLEIDNLIRLGICEWKVNERFFMQRIMPMLGGLVRKNDTNDS